MKPCTLLFTLDLRTKLAVATELRDTIETARDADSARVIPHMIPVILEVLRSGTPSTKKDSVDYAFRRVLLDIIHRIPLSEAVRPQALPLLQGMLHLIHTDNEDVGYTCCKISLDILRIYKPPGEELVVEFMKVYKECINGTDGAVKEYFSEGSKTLESNDALMSIHSCKVLAEMALIIGTIIQSNRAVPLPLVQEAVPLNLRFLALEAPAQKKAREDSEAMGNVWVGVAPTVPNVSIYTDFVGAQVKVCSNMYSHSVVYILS